MALREFVGGAPRTTLNGAINNSVLSLVLTSGTNYPTGTSPFVLVIDRGLSTEEKVLCSARSGNNVTITTRGYDSTTAQAHASGAYVEHVLDATTITEMNLHANDADADNIAHAASKISNTPAGGIAATTVQAAIDELDTEKMSKSGGTFTGDISVPDEVYDATAWNASTEVPTKNAVRDKFESLAGGTDRTYINGFGLVADNVAAATQMYRLSNDAGTAAARQFSVIVTRAGSITGLMVASSAARTAGDITFEVYKNGSATGLTVAIDGTNTQYHYATQAAGTDTFVAGDKLDVRATEGVNFTPNNYFEAIIEVQFS